MWRSGKGSTIRQVSFKFARQLEQSHAIGNIPMIENMHVDAIDYRRHPPITQESRHQMNPIQYNETPALESRA